MGGGALIHGLHAAEEGNELAGEPGINLRQLRGQGVPLGRHGRDLGLTRRLALAHYRSRVEVLQALDRRRQAIGRELGLEEVAARAGHDRRGGGRVERAGLGSIALVASAGGAPPRPPR
jgi:hypothetical protein